MTRDTKRTLLSVLTVIAILAGAGLITLVSVLNYTPRTSILRIYNWEDYIDKSLITDFQDYYRELTGDHKFKIEYHEFSDNEELYSKIKTQKVDYDLIVPSEYMVEKMRNEGLLKPIDTDRLTFTAADDHELTYDDIMDPNILARTRQFSDTADGQVWAIPYIIGTVGIMYDTNVIDRMSAQTGITVDEFEDLLHQYGFGILFGEGGTDVFKGHITMKKSSRDTVGIASIYGAREDLANAETEDEFNDILDQALNMKGDYTLAKAREILLKQIETMAPIYENDDGKLAFQTDYNTYAYGLYWNCDAGVVMIDEEETTYENVKFYAPDGTNLWTDNIALPIYGTQNQETTDACYEFIKFMLSTENAMPNIEAAGSIMGNAEANDALREEWYEEDNEWMDNYLDTMFPTEEVIKHTAIMHQFATETLEDDVNNLMIELMSESATPSYTLLIIWVVVIAVLGIAGLTYFLVMRRIRK